MRTLSNAIVMILLIIGLLILSQLSCQRDQFKGLSMPDTLVSNKPYQVPVLKKMDVPVTVTIYPVDTSLRQKLENRPIITDIKKKTVKKPFRKPKEILEITRIDTAAQVQTLTYELSNPDADREWSVDYTITTEGMATDPKSIKRAKRKLFWRKVGNTAKDIGKVAGGAAATYIIIKQID